MSKLKVSIIGCGSIAINRHIPEFHDNKNVEIVAVCDIVSERAEKMAELYDTKAYTDYKEVLKLSEVDAVSVCLPNYLHAPVSIDALNAGKHVLCEKPMATSQEEADEMIAAAKKNDKKLMIAHNQRFVDSHRKAKEIIDSGKLGKIFSFKTTFGHPGPEDWSIDGASSWFFKKEEAYMGAMGDLGVHKADLMRYLLGDFSEVGSFIETNAKENTDVDDNAVCVLRTENGVIGTLAASWAYVTGSYNGTIIYGQEGTLRLEDDPEHSLIEEYKNGHVIKHKLSKIQSNEDGARTNTHVIDHFVESVLENKQPLIDGEEGMKSLQIILGAIKSQETKQIISLK
ncbi:Gfo/Idh/MocA family protein [Evansella cellulosilytica]|uniref:Oxidoreductase domain protein n=1 Tax=Evansella cellulosilytica (strain ATCC 21833 / DSM 2522 / FERM P-1141 / JCM 9156 / N-4) TaxID=649639 RepID=E6TQL3_EVAC2|nr:Gfo/Idh/MocA family oxidoreductase [Evansella cellulosilytica]ADU30524.1 oxidoreductase domain protein [Evansella cellulosilytica DSM 2522]